MFLVIFNFARAISAALRNGYRAPKICERIRADRLNELTAEFRGLQNLSDDVFQFTGNQPVTHDCVKMCFVKGQLGANVIPFIYFELVRELDLSPRG